LSVFVEQQNGLRAVFFARQKKLLPIAVTHRQVVSLVGQASAIACSNPSSNRRNIMTATTRTLSATALVLALGSALSIAAVSTVHAADDNMEKCFGVAMKGKNDCAAGAGTEQQERRA
jgi:hypothetical protein